MSTLGRLLWSVFRAPVKGALGETAVKAGAALALPSSVYRRYHDVTLPTAGGTTQIDHVFVSVFGVFVVETKNMNGWIYGRAQNRVHPAEMPPVRTEDGAADGTKGPNEGGQFWGCEGFPKCRAVQET